MLHAKDFLDEFKKERNFKKSIPYLKENPFLCESLLELIEQQAEYPYAEHASWLWMHIARDLPDYAIQFRSRLIDVLFQSKNESILRNVLNALLEFDLTDYREAELISLLFDFLQNKSHKVALHVYSIYYLMKFLKTYPELKQELDLCVSVLMENASPALHVAARNLKKG